MQAWISSLLGYLLPTTCLLCQAVVSTPGCCLDCTARLPWLRNGCWRCAKPLAEAGLCGRCCFKPPAFRQTISPFRYAPPIDAWITGLKFHEQLAFVPFLADCLWRHCVRHYQGQDWPQLIIPVPLHSARLRMRGFNQALLIAVELAKRSKIPLARTCVSKDRLTRPQTALSKVAREKNVRHAFTLKRALKETHVALIDDVLTTGATAREIAILLLKQGVKRVDVWCVARTV